MSPHPSVLSRIADTKRLVKPAWRRFRTAQAINVCEPRRHFLAVLLVVVRRVATEEEAGSHVHPGGATMRTCGLVTWQRVSAAIAAHRL